MALLLIDGYNLLFQTDHHDRETLIRDLVRLQKARGHRIRVVFDGTHGGGRFRSEEIRAGVEIQYSSLFETADEVLEETLDRKEADWMVISSDRRIQKHAQIRGAVYLESRDFLIQMADAKNAPSTTSTRSPQGGRRSTMDALLDEDQPWIKPEDPPAPRKLQTQKKGNPRRLSKKARKQKKALKKI